jgi:hypothetical protein
MYRNYCTEAIVFAAEHHLQLLPFYLNARRRHRRFSFVSGVRVVEAFFLGHREIHASLVQRFFQFFKSGKLNLDALLLLQDRLRRFGIVPEVLLDRLVGKFLPARD